MSATVVYGTVAYLLARLQKHGWARAITLLFAVVMIALICFTRLYLGVHYPSDVLGGIIVGLAWSGFCMATLEASLVLARRRAPARWSTRSPRRWSRPSTAQRRTRRSRTADLALRGTRCALPPSQRAPGRVRCTIPVRGE